MQVFLNKRPNHLKSALLAPFVGRYRSCLHLKRIPIELVQVAAQSVAMSSPKAFFAKNYKAACSSVSHAIHFWETGETCAGDIHVTPHLEQGLRQYAALVDALTDPVSFKFSFVRDPQSRAVSAFTNFFLDRSNEGRRKHEPFLPAAIFDDTISIEARFDLFLDYVEACVARDPLFADSHFRPQFFNVRPDLVRYDFIGRVESLDADLLALEDLLRPPHRLPEEQPSKARNASVRKYEPMQRQVSRIRMIYEPDYQWFDYG